MKFVKRISNYFLIFLISITVLFCFEKFEALEKRINFSKHIAQISNNKIKLVASQRNGISCLSNDLLFKGEILMKISKKFSLCSSYLFPFKFEILEILTEITDIKDRLGKDQKVTIYLLTYYLLYFMYAPKQKIRDYILQNKLKEYYNIDEIEESLRQNFPEIIPGAGLLDLEHYNLLSSLGYNLRYDLELKEVFEKIRKKILQSQSDFKEIVYPWVSDYERFKWAYSMVMSRSMTIKFINSNPDKQKNNDVNKLISPPSIGAPCIIGFGDLINHYQPKYVDYRDSIYLSIDSEKDKDYFFFYSPKNLTTGKEILFSYSENPSNTMLLFNYGFIIPNNIFNFYHLKIKDESKLNLSQLGICRELKCFDLGLNENAYDQWKLPDVRHYKATQTQIVRNLLNYGKVLFLDKNFDKKLVLKTLNSDYEEIISFENEVKAWIYYFNSFKKISSEKEDFAISTNFTSLENSMKMCQKYRNIVMNIYLNWIDEETKKDTWKRFKIYENIYLLDISYKKIVIRQMLVSINHVIKNTKNEIESLKTKYLF